MPSANYLTQQKAISHQVQWLVELELDRCSLVYTQGACTATDQGDGRRCYYSFGTCQVPLAYSRTTRIYRFVLNDVPWNDTAVQVYPYLDRIVSVPQRIDPDKLTTYPEKIQVMLAADWDPPPPDSDKGAGFFNTTTAGEFWRTLVARNRNYVNRPVRIYRGFNATSFVLADFEKVGPTYKVRSIVVQGDKVVIEAESDLRRLNEIVIPFSISEDNTIQNGGGISNVATSVTVLRASEYPNPADYTRFNVYAKMEDEIVQVTARDTSTNILTIVRNRLGTSNVAHAAGIKVDHVAFFGTDNGASATTARNVVEVMRDLLHWAKIADADIDTTTFDAVKAGAWPESDIKRTITKPQKIARHLQPLKETRGVAIFINAAGKWAAAVMSPDTIAATLDEDRLLLDSVTLDEDDESRLTRVSVWWDPSEENPSDDAKHYRKGCMNIDAGLETANSMGDVKERVVFDAWLDPAIAVAYVRNMGRRMITRFRYGVRTLGWKLDILDNLRNVGDMVHVETRHVQDRNGVTAAVPVFIVEKRETDRAQSQYSGVDVNFGGRYLRIGPDTMPDDYDTATAAERQYGYWGDTNNRVGDVKDEGYVFW